MERQRLSLVQRAMLFFLVLVLVGLFQSGLGDRNGVSARTIKFASDPEFFADPNGMAAFQEEYEFQFDVVYQMVIGLTHEALRASDVDAAMGYPTDGRIERLQLVTLDDDREFFSNSYVAPVIREQVLETYPEIEHILAELAVKLDKETMVSFNYLIELEDHDVYELADRWLDEQVFFDEPSRVLHDGDAVRVGGSDFGEPRILGVITILLLESRGIPTDDHTLPVLFGPSRDRMLAGDLDLYFECSRTSLRTQDDELKFSEYSGEEVFAEVALRDEEKGLVWLDYPPFSNRRAILMRKEHAEELGITTMTEFAAWVNETQDGQSEDE